MNYNVNHFGALGDNTTDNTLFIQKAIDKCSETGGGKVIISNGTYLSSTLYFRNNVILYIDNNATLKCIADTEKLSTDTHYQMYKKESHMDRCFIYGENVSNIGIVGYGCIHGQGDKFPSNNRPMLCRYLNCNNIRINNISFKDPASWTNAFIGCTDIVVDGVNIKSRANNNGDGLDFDGCKNIFVSNCNFDCSDDCICLQNSFFNRVCENAVIQNCIFVSQWAGIRIGLLSCGDIKDVVVNNCIFKDINCSGLKIQSAEGAVISDMIFSNLIMSNIQRPIFITLNYYRERVNSDDLISTPSVVKNLKFNNIIAKSKEHNYGSKDNPSCMIIDSVDGFYIENIQLNNIEFHNEIKDKALSIIKNPPHHINKRAEASNYKADLPAFGLYARNVKNLTLDNFQCYNSVIDDKQALFFEGCINSNINNNYD